MVISQLDYWTQRILLKYWYLSIVAHGVISRERVTERVCSVAAVYRISPGNVPTKEMIPDCSVIFLMNTFYCTVIISCKERASGNRTSSRKETLTQLRPVSAIYVETASLFKSYSNFYRLLALPACITTGGLD